MNSHKVLRGSLQLTASCIKHKVQFFHLTLSDTVSGKGGIGCLSKNYRLEPAMGLDARLPVWPGLGAQPSSVRVPTGSSNCLHLAP